MGAVLDSMSGMGLAARRGLAGVHGGFSAVFGPPTVAYLIARDTE